MAKPKLCLFNFFWCRALRMTSPVGRQTTKTTTTTTTTAVTMNTPKHGKVHNNIIFRFVLNVCTANLHGKCCAAVSERHSRRHATCRHQRYRRRCSLHFSLPLVSLLFVRALFFVSEPICRSFSIYFSLFCSLRYTAATRSVSWSNKMSGTKEKTTDDDSRITKMII